MTSDITHAEWIEKTADARRVYHEQLFDMERPCVRHPAVGATHKIAHEDAFHQGWRLHEFTNYVCCDCMAELFGATARRWCEADHPPGLNIDVGYDDDQEQP